MGLIRQQEDRRLSPRILTEEGRVRHQGSPCRSAGDKVVMEWVLHRVLRFSPVSIITPLGVESRPQIHKKRLT